jgi:hypothetical protein
LNGVPQISAVFSVRRPAGRLVKIGDCVAFAMTHGEILVRYAEAAEIMLRIAGDDDLLVQKATEAQCPF